MRYFFSLLFLFFAASTSAQVTISNDVSRWFLEQNEKVKVYEKQVDLLRQDIKTLELQIVMQRKEVNLYMSDANVYNTLIQLKDKEIALKKDELKKTRRQVVKYKLIAGGAIAVAVLVTIFK